MLERGRGVWVVWNKVYSLESGYWMLDSRMTGCANKGGLCLVVLEFTDVAAGAHNKVYSFETKVERKRPNEVGLE